MLCKSNSLLLILGRDFDFLDESSLRIRDSIILELELELDLIEH